MKCVINTQTLNINRINSLCISQFSSVAHSCLTLCDAMNCSPLGLTVHHQLPESIQTHVHWVCDAIQPSHPLPSPSPPALNLSQHQGLFKWVSFSASGGQSIGVSALASVLPMNTQDWSPLGWTGWISFIGLLVGESPRDSQESSPTPQFKSINSFKPPNTFFFFKENGW